MSWTSGKVNYYVFDIMHVQWNLSWEIHLFCQKKCVSCNTSGPFKRGL